MLLLTFIGDRIGGWILEQIVQKSQFRYTRLYNQQAESDILLVGNSRGLMFYQPTIEELTGKSTLNLSYNSMPINLGRALLQDYFENYPAPEQVILDVTMCDRLNNQLIAGFNLYTPKSTHVKQLIRDSIPKDYYGGMVTHLYRYNSEVFQRTLNYINKSDEDWLLDRVINDYMVEEAQSLETFRITYDTSFTNELNAIKQLCQSKGTQLNFVINPYYPPFAESITNLDSIKNVIQTQVGVSISDYSRALTDREDFGDYQHTNKTGARKYMQMLLQDGILKK